MAIAFIASVVGGCFVLAHGSNPWEWVEAFHLTSGRYVLSAARGKDNEYAAPSMKILIYMLNVTNAATVGNGLLSRAEAAAHVAWERADALSAIGWEEARSQSILLHRGERIVTFRLSFDMYSWISYFSIDVRIDCSVAVFTEHKPANFEGDLNKHFFRKADGSTTEPIHYSENPKGSEVAVHGSKFLGILCILLSALTGVFLRLRCPAMNSPRLFGYVNVLAGSTFVSMALFHILPETIEDAPLAINTLVTSDPSAMGVMVFVFVGFALVLFFEHVACGSQGSPDEQCEEALKDVLNPSRSLIARARSSSSQAFPTLVARVRSTSSSSQGLISAPARARSSSSQGMLQRPDVELQPRPVTPKEGPFVDPSLAAAILSPCDERSPGTSHENSPPHSSQMRSQEDVGRPEHDTGVDGAGGVGAVLLMAALSVHAVFEGLVIGTSSTVSTIWVFVVIVTAHKWAEGFAIANQLTPQQLESWTAFALLSLFSFASPIGAVIGWTIESIADEEGSSSAKIVECVLNCVACGTLLYVGMVEMVPQEFCAASNVVSKFVVFLVTAGCVFGLTLLENAFES